MKHDIIDMGSDAGATRHHVRVVVQFGPVASILVLPPDAMAHVCEQFADIATRVVPEARRMDTMSGFQVVSGDALPKLPPLNGTGGVGGDART